MVSPSGAAMHPVDSLSLNAVWGKPALCLVYVGIGGMRAIKV